MTVHARDALVAELVDARLHHRRLERDELPGTLEAAQALQLEVLEQLEAAGHQVSGWKLGLTSGQAHDMMGPGVRPFGYILADRTSPSGSVVERPAGATMFSEPELCLELGQPLRGEGLTREACMAAVRCVKAAFEINQSRIRMPGRNHLFVADGLSNWGMVLGNGKPPEVAPERPLVELWHNGQRIRTSEPDLRMDDAFTSLATLCAHLHRHGRGLAAGQHVITGAFFRQPIDGPGNFRATFAGLGEVSFVIR